MFDKVYISDGVKTSFSTHGLGNIELIACVKTGQRQKILLAKILSNVSLKTLTILTKRLILDACLGAGRASAD